MFEVKCEFEATAVEQIVSNSVHCSETLQRLARVASCNLAVRRAHCASGKFVAGKG